MADPSIEQAIANALAGLVQYVDARPNNATDDDDARALEDVAFHLNQVAEKDRPQLRSLLGDEVAIGIFGPTD